MSKEELDPYEKEVKRATDEYNKRLNKKDPYESELKKTKDEVEEDEGGFFDEGSAFRTTAAIGTEIAANTLLDLFSFIPPAQYAGGAAINYFAQRIRGGEFSQGEMIAAGLASLLPGGAQAKSLGGVIGKGVARGALSGAIETGAADLIDTGEIDAERLGQGALVGGAFGGIFSYGASQKGVQRGIKYFQDRIKGEKFAKLSPEDALELGLGQPMMSVDPDRPRYPLSELIIPKKRGEDRSALAIMNASGMVDGRLDIDVYKTIRDREAVAIFLTPRGKGVPFDIAQKATIASLNRKYGPNLQKLGLSGSKSLQAHHNVPLKASLPAFHGLVKDSPKFDKFMQLYYNELLSLGDMPKNIVPALGDTRVDKVSGGKKYNSPHYLIHKFIRDVMGEDGLKFWTPDELDNLVVRQGENGPITGTINDARREELIKEQIGLFKRAQDILRIGMEEYRLLGSTEQIMPEEIVEAFTNKLPTDLDYEPGLIKSIVREIAEETNITPTVKPSIQDVFDKQSREIFDEMYKFAVNEANGEEMLIDVIFNGLSSKKAINKWRKNDPQMQQLSIRFKKAIKQAKSGEGFKKLKELYQIKQGEIPPADTTFDKGAD